jgi:2-polyprenyl-3-methyl-5-hydroxy-6-metoxy-1,4-benzoquinol methylase
VLGGYTIHRCPGCNHHYAPEAFPVPVNYDEVYKTREYLEAQAATLAAGPTPGAYADIATYRIFFRTVPWRSGAHLLDVGCGVGRFCHAAHSRNWDVTGIDIAEEAISLGKRYADFPLQVARLEDAAHWPQKFAAVTAFEVLEHLHEPVSFLKLLSAAAQEGGTVFCTVPNWECPQVQQATRPDWVPPVHLSFFTAASLLRAATAAGLRDVQAGIIYADSRPLSLVRLPRWIARRLLGRANPPWGLYVRGRR